ncbi:MAG: hypothetical protein IPM17_13135 [Verrucomicrobia bacterium]|nr:hypothetical protein [Verrucomicrobiota bacterium]
MVAAVVLAAVIPARANLIVHNSPQFSDNNTYRNAWLADIGISSPQWLVDFESGFTDNQNIKGAVIGPDLTIGHTDSGTTVTVQQGAGVIGGSNPIGSFAAMFSGQAAGATLTFSQPVDYVGFYDIDRGTGDVTVNLVGGESFTFSMDTTAAAGNSAEFWGVFRNDKNRISSLVFAQDSGGGGWGIDNIQYGVIPEPSVAVQSLALLTPAFGFLAYRRWRGGQNRRDH